MPHRRVGSERARLWPGSFTCPADAKRKGPVAGTRQSPHRPLILAFPCPSRPPISYGASGVVKNALKKLSVFVVSPFRATTVFVLAATSVLSSAVLDANVEDVLAPAVTLSS